MNHIANAVLLQHNLKALNLTNMARQIEQHLRQARDGGIDYTQFLLELTELELRIRSENREKRRLKEARFPLLKPLEVFDFEATPALDKRLVRELATGAYSGGRTEGRSLNGMKLIIFFRSGARIPALKDSFWREKADFKELQG